MRASIRPLAATDPTHLELVSRAKALVPRLRERALEVERSRRLCPDTLDELREAELWRALQPREYGGYELDLSVILDLGFELGRGCTSTAWVYENNSMHSLLAGLFPRQAQEDLWGDVQSHRTLATGWPYKHAAALPVEGGFRLAGHWQFASGCHSAEGAIVRAPVVNDSPGSKPDMRLFMLFGWQGDYGSSTCGEPEGCRAREATTWWWRIYSFRSTGAWPCVTSTAVRRRSSGKVPAYTIPSGTGFP